MALKLLKANSLSKVKAFSNVGVNSPLPAGLFSSKSQIARLCIAEDLPEPLYKPYDYENKSYGFLQSMYEFTTKRFTVNTKHIVIEGNIGTDKAAVGKKLAEAFGMRFFPDAKEEMCFINHNGFDLRKLNPQLEGSDKFFDLTDLNQAENPKDVMGFGRTQIQMLVNRFERHRQAHQHLLATGQGVISERSVYGDRTFVDGLRKKRYFTRDGKEFYLSLYDRMKRVLWKPHLFIYIHQSVDECLENIAKRNNPIEKGSKLLTKDYLQAIQDSFEKHVLPFIGVYSEVEILTTEDLNNLDEVVLRLQSLDLDPPVDGEPYKFMDWYKEKEAQWHMYRTWMEPENYFLKSNFYVDTRPRTCEEMDIKEQRHYVEVVHMHPSSYYAPGYMPKDVKL